VDDGHSRRRRLHGRLALVTGAAQGIGSAIADAFLAEDAEVIAADINLAKLEQSPGRPRMQLERLDVTDESAVRDIAERHRDVDVLVNCAGHVATGSILTASRADMERSYQVNVIAVFSMIRAFLPAMLARGRGSIINIGSVVSTVKSAADRCAYAASKGAVIALTKSVALDLIRCGIRCNVISPGTVHTPSLGDRVAAMPDPDDALRQFIARQPLGRLGRASEVAAVAVLLASDEAAFMTGSNVVIDGGFSL
jgi:2-keto-3-deoxy-L-fuconate dehydrogenase